jgi:hypothetical protein
VYGLGNYNAVPVIRPGRSRMGIGDPVHRPAGMRITWQPALRATAIGNALMLAG